jgi:hypothetical protein
MGRTVLVVVILFCSIASVAQYNKANRSNSGSIIDRLYFSGGGGFGSGTGANGRYNYFSILPTVGYKVRPEFLVGMNFSYSKYSYPDYDVSYDQIGFAPFARYYIEQLFFQLEYDKISSLKFDYQNGLSSSRKYYDRLLVGVGYKAPLGKRSAINAMGLYDLLYQNNGVFASPFVFRVFISF